MTESVPRLRLARQGAMTTILALVAAALSVAPAAAAGSYSYGSPAPAATPAPAGTPAPAATAGAPASMQVGTTSTSALGEVLTGPTGMTLYTLSSDPVNGSVCTAKCLSFWPPLLVAPGGTVAGPSGSSLMFSTFTRPDDGTVQVTADGHALYYFANDAAPGQVNGDGIKGAGGVWHAASQAAISASAAPASAAPVSAAPAAAVPVTGAAGALPGSSAAPASTRSPAADNSSVMPIGLFGVVLVLAIIAVAYVGVRRMRGAGNR